MSATAATVACDVTCAALSISIVGLILLQVALTSAVGIYLWRRFK